MHLDFACCRWVEGSNEQQPESSPSPLSLLHFASCLLQVPADHWTRSRFPQVTLHPAASSRHHSFRLSVHARSQSPYALDRHCVSHQRYRTYLISTAKASQQSSAVASQKVAFAMVTFRAWELCRGLRGAHPVQGELCENAFDLLAAMES